MRIPIKLNILGLEWEIKFDSNVSEEGGSFGSAHLKTQKIFLSPEAKPTKIPQTLLHEILHALWWSSGLPEQEEIHKHQEQVIRVLAIGLQQVLKENDLDFRGPNIIKQEEL